jgi:uncharacterized protein YjiS (DUF1127 family)
MSLMHEACRVWAMHREFRAVVKELSAYSDRGLDDLGIRRADIARIAFQEAERRILTPVSSDVDEVGAVPGAAAAR